MALGLMLSGCEPEQDSLIGTWTVDKVNVQFDENHSTPALVKQVGEMEKQNTFSIGADSTIVFKGMDEQWEGRISMVNDSLLYCRETVFGVWRKEKVITKTTSPLGEVVVSYKKE